MSANGYIVTADTVKANMNILVYGDPGAGKTHFACTAQDHDDLAGVIVLNVEGGLMTVAARGDIRAINVTGICTPTKVSDRKGTSLEELFWRFANDDEAFEDIHTIVIDSVTELQQLNLDEIVTTSGRADRDFVQMQDYGKSTVQLKRLFRMFRDLPRNVIWTALAKPLIKGKGESAQVVGMVPSLTEKLGASLMGYVDFVWFLFTEEDAEGEIQRALLTETFNGFKAKTRGLEFAKALGLKVVNPSMPEMYATFIESMEAN